MFADPLTEWLAAFVRSIGIDVRAASLPKQTLLRHELRTAPRRRQGRAALPPHAALNRRMLA
jgi:hypothetical protein